MQKFACGVDEVGRGALAGPIVVASVVFKNYENNEISQINIFVYLSRKKNL